MSSMQIRVSQELLYLISLCRKILNAASSVQRMDFQTWHMDVRLLLRRYWSAPTALNVCNCSVSQSCPDPSWSSGHIFWKNGNNRTKGSVVWSVPSLIKSCEYYWWNDPAIWPSLFLQSDLPWNSSIYVQIRHARLATTTFNHSKYDRVTKFQLINILTTWQIEYTFQLTFRWHMEVAAKLDRLLQCMHSD
jgi:hypothetical protein